MLLRAAALTVVLIVAVAAYYTPPAPPEPVQTPKEKARLSAEDALFKTNVLAVRRVRAGMKNPDSFKLEQVLRMADGTLCLTYRATNSFNATVPGRAVVAPTGGAMVDGQTGFIDRWNAKCGGKTGDDVTYLRTAL